MTLNIRIPSRFDVATRFFGRFSWQDIARIGLPAAAGYAAAPMSNPGLQAGATAAGLLVGTLLYGYRPHDRTLDSHLYHAARWLVGKRRVEGSQTENVKDGYIETSSGTAIGVVKVTPTNLEMKTEPEQGALHDIFKELLESVTYPIQVFSPQHAFDMEAYAQKIWKSGKEPERLRKNYGRYCRYIAVDQTVETTKHYVAIRVTKDGVGGSLDNRTSELDKRCNEVANALSGGDLSAERLTGRDLNQWSQTVSTPLPELTTTWTSTTSDGGIGNARKTLAVTQYPDHLPLGWTTELLQVDGQVDINQVIRPKSPGKTSKKLQRVIQKLSGEIDSWLAAGYLGTNDLEARLEDADWMLDRLSSRTDQPFDYAVYITAKGDTKADCAATYEQVKKRLRTMQIDFDELTLRTDQALQAASPLYGDPVDESQLVPGSSAATGFPFATQTVEQDSGVVYGLDASDSTPILLDRFDWSSHSMARMGTTGSGKSYATKLELLRAWFAYDDLQIYVVDPKQEYSHLVRQLGGTMYTLGQDSRLGFKTDDVYGYTVAERGASENVDRMTAVIERIYEATSEDDTKTLVVVDEAHQLMNDEEGREVLARFIREARDTSTAVTLVSQNASDFTHCREGRTILDNVPAKAFMRHERVPDDVVQYFNLSRREEQELYKLKDGTDADYSEAVLKVSDRVNAKIRIDAHSAEHAVINQ